MPLSRAISSATSSLRPPRVFSARMIVSQASSMEAAGWAADSQSVASPTPMSSPRTSTSPSVHITSRSPAATGTRTDSKGTPPTPIGAPVGSSSRSLCPSPARTSTGGMWPALASSTSPAIGS